MEAIFLVLNLYNVEENENGGYGRQNFYDRNCWT